MERLDLQKKLLLIRDCKDPREKKGNNQRIPLARWQGSFLSLSPDLLNTLRKRELAETTAKLARETGLAHHSLGEGEHVTGIYACALSWTRAALPRSMTVLASSSSLGGRPWSSGSASMSPEQ